jgi:hypothetical protein
MVKTEAGWYHTTKKGERKEGREEGRKEEGRERMEGRERKEERKKNRYGTLVKFLGASSQNCLLLFSFF